MTSSYRARSTSRPVVRGRVLDCMTRCVHYHSALDIVAIRFKCCGEYYACHACHQESAGHRSERWPVSASDEKAALCGACWHEMSVGEYLSCGDMCPNCGARFNPGCVSHRSLYFEGRSGTATGYSVSSGKGGRRDSSRSKNPPPGNRPGPRRRRPPCAA